MHTTDGVNTKGFLIRSQPRMWQAANSDAYLHEVLASLKIDSPGDRQDADVAVELAAQPQGSTVAGPSESPLPATGPDSAFAHFSATPPTPAIPSSSATTSFDPFAAARRARAFTAPHRDVTDRQQRLPAPPIRRHSIRPFFWIIDRGVKRTQLGGQRAASNIGPLGSSSTGHHVRSRHDKGREPQQHRTASQSIRQELASQRRRQDRVVQLCLGGSHQCRRLVRAVR